MRVWLDNTGFQSVGECLNGTARSEADIDGLLQFCTFAIFSDQVVLNGFEPPAIAEQSEAIRQAIRLPIADLRIVPETESGYAAACRRAAEDLEYLLPSSFGETTRTGEPLALTDIRAALPRHARQFNFEQLFTEDVDLLAERAHGAVKFMLRFSGGLREAAVRLYQDAEAWTDADTHRLNVFIRYHLNCELARAQQATYGPAIARAVMIRDENQRAIDRLMQATDDTVRKVRPKPLRIGSVASALVQRGRGEPLAMIQEAYALKEKARPLRRWISEAAAAARDADAVTFDQMKLIGEAKAALEIELGIQPTPGQEAIEISAPLGAKIAPDEAIAVLKWLRHRSRIAVLTDISKTAAAPHREEEYYCKLRSIAFRHAS